MSFRSLIQVVTVRKQDALRHGANYAPEVRVTLVASTAAFQLTFHFQYDRQNLANVLVREICYLHLRYIYS